MKPIYFDIHTHLNFSEFDSDRNEAISRCLDNNTWLINVGSNIESSKQAIKISEEHEKGVYSTVGLHPTDYMETELPVGFRELAKHPKVVAIGECGLEYFRIKGEAEKIRQRKIFIEQIELALELDKPLVIHCREACPPSAETSGTGRRAHDDIIKILEGYKNGRRGGKLRGDLHFFSGNMEQAKKYIELGFLISFTGVITFTSEYDEVIKEIPLEKIMIETDAPYVAPVPYRGKRNEPSYVVEVAKRIAEIKGISVEEVAKITTQNALNLFGII